MKRINGKTMITAHSGCDNTKDNSLEFVHYALKNNCDCLEADIREKNGQLILTHDEAADGADPVLLEDVFLLLKETNSKINCDLKEPGLEEKVLQLAEKAGVKDHLIYTGTVDIEKFSAPGELSETVDVYVNVEVISEYMQKVYSGEIVPSEEGLMQAMQKIASRLADYSVAGININYRYCPDAVLECLYRLSVPVSLWTVKEPERAEELVRLHAANITTRNFRAIQQICGSIRN